MTAIDETARGTEIEGRGTESWQVTGGEAATDSDAPINFGRGSTIKTHALAGHMKLHEAKHPLESEHSMSGSEATNVSPPASSSSEFEESGEESKPVAHGDKPAAGESKLAAEEHKHPVVSVPKPDSSRKKRKRKRHRLLITHTMGMEPAKALQLVIENTEARLQQHYALGSVLGEGSFGVVHKAKLKVNGAKRAVKSINKDFMRRAIFLLKEEISIMKKLDHPNLLMLMEIFEDKKNIHLVLEFCAGGNLAEYLTKKKQASEAESAVVMQQLLRAAQYLHNHAICHRDFKTDNCLLSESGPLEKARVKVADFGISCTLKAGKYLTRICGTPTHMAPEVLAKKYKHGCDLWSCGVIVFQLLSGDLPFKGETKEKLFDEIRHSRIEDHLNAAVWVDTSDMAFDFMKSLCTKNPRNRPSAREALGFPWMQRLAEHVHELEVPETFVAGLGHFRRANKFKRAVLQTVASMLPDTETVTAQRAFHLLDINGDGSFTTEELANALSSGVLQHSNIQIEQEVRLLNESFSDTDVKAFTYSEFVAAFFDQRKAEKQGLFRSAFDSLDKNGDHSLSIAELATGHLLGTLSRSEVGSVVAETIESCDLNGDGVIEYREWKKMFSSLDLSR